MCGIAAVINGNIDEVIKMGKAIAHRGTSQHVDEYDNLKVYFTHLPITDLENGNQPFTYGKYVVWMNGYISNYQELAEEFDIKLETKCDTELLAKLLGLYNGRYMERLNGFFSVLIYNKEQKTVDMFTDRYGIKQLYTYQLGSKLYVASEVKALRAVVPLELSNRGISDFVYSLGVMCDDTIFEGVQRVPRLKFSLRQKIKIGYHEACEKLYDLWIDSRNRNAIGNNIKTGVFLSGGVDSGIVANTMKPDFSFSMDYVDAPFSEIENIKLNSRGIHHTLICNRDLFNTYKFQNIVVLDDLKAGSSYTNLALTEMASKFCTVLYSGAGGDEVFDGYTHRYNKPLQEVVKRTSIMTGKYIEYVPPINHKEYDWRFLRAVLVVEDRMAGFHAMETRYPLLDNEFVDFALSLPAEYRFNKKILKEICGLKPEVTAGKKRGFSNPYFTNDEWTAFAINETRDLLHGIRRD